MKTFVLYAAIVCNAATLITGCAGLPPRTYTLFGETPEGAKVGASVTLGDTRTLRDK